MSAAHNNNGLFSDHYLSRHLPELSGEDLERARADQQALRAIYAEGVPLADGADEQVCEYQLLRPTLERLGFAMDPQPPLRTVESTFKPDYALFADRAALEEAVQAGRGEDAYFDLALAVGEAKRWDRDLGSAEPGDSEAATRQHPGAQTRRYLLDSSVRWGILTNGCLWRIYERERSRAGFRYYEVDLPALLEADVQDFRYFWLLFRRAAYQADEAGVSPIGDVLEGSRRYWLGLTDRLRGRVYDALGTLMTGMIEGSPALSDDDLPAVHEASLIVLYRLLFCFYAEARDLLPTSNAVYRENHSAETKLGEVAGRRDTGGTWSRSGRALWQWFRDLSRIIDEGDPDETGVPEYDGGLFDPAEWPLLGDPDVIVPDDCMAEVIDRIGRDWDIDTGDRAFLDYSELTVRELGSIYEGLLEMRPQRDGHEIVLLTDRGERKATGSYYTPEYIVDYIVTNTLDPLLTEAAAQVKARLPECEAAIAVRERAIADRERDHPDSAQNLRAIDELKLELLEPYFELMVLDPAMGSGHFLVAASEEITEAIITDPSHMPPAEAADEDDENIFYKRRVVERCLYGVDLNPLAVELAKLSLWLHTVEFGKPLSFLKHHLREGNSLIGARLQEMHCLPNGPAEASGQLNLFTQSFMPEATRMLQAFNLIEHMPTDTLAQEREKEAAWEEIEQRREHFRQVANVWLSTYFGNTVDDADYARAVDALGAPAAFDDIEREEWFAAAQNVASEHDFFHWELEFPDAFFTEQGPKREGDRGFDAVVGNPPWVVYSGRQAVKITADKMAYFRSTFDAARGWASSHGMFMEMVAGHLRCRRTAGMIVPTQVLHLSGYSSARKALLRKAAQVGGAVCWSETAFEDVTEPSATILFQRRTSMLSDPEDTIDFDEGKSNPAVRVLSLMDRVSPLPADSFGDPGVHSGNSADIILASTPDELRSPAPIREGKDVERYHAHNPTLLVDQSPELPEGHYCTIRPYERYVTAVILIRQTADRPIAALHDSAAYFRNSVLACYGAEGVDTQSLLAILNSSAAAFYHRETQRDSRHRAFPQMKVAHLRQLPIPLTKQTTSAEDEAIAKQWLRRLEERADETGGNMEP